MSVEMNDKYYISSSRDRKHTFAANIVATNIFCRKYIFFKFLSVNPQLGKKNTC